MYNIPWHMPDIIGNKKHWRMCLLCQNRASTSWFPLLSKIRPSIANVKQSVSKRKVRRHYNGTENTEMLLHNNFSRKQASQIDKLAVKWVSESIRTGTEAKDKKFPATGPWVWELYSVQRQGSKRTKNSVMEMWSQFLVNVTAPCKPDSGFFFHCPVSPVVSSFRIVKRKRWARSTANC